jgi:hypothetical protein
MGAGNTAVKCHISPWEWKYRKRRLDGKKRARSAGGIRANSPKKKKIKSLEFGNLQRIRKSGIISPKKPSLGKSPMPI